MVKCHWGPVYLLKRVKPKPTETGNTGISIYRYRYRSTGSWVTTYRYRTFSQNALPQAIASEYKKVKKKKEKKKQKFFKKKNDDLSCSLWGILCSPPEATFCGCNNDFKNMFWKALYENNFNNVTDVFLNILFSLKSH